MKKKEIEVNKLGSEFGERLRNIRQDKGLTQYDLAVILDTSQRMIAHYESHIKRPPLDKIKDFARALNVSVEELIGEKELADEQRDGGIPLHILKYVKIIEKLPIRDQKIIFNLIKYLAKENEMSDNIEKIKKTE